jgi:hypothetical protein
VDMNPAGPGTKNDCADEDHQNVSVRPNASSGEYPNKKKNYLRNLNADECVILKCILNDWCKNVFTGHGNFRTSRMATFINTCTMNLQLLQDGNQNRPTGGLVELTQIFLLKVAYSRNDTNSFRL